MGLAGDKRPRRGPVAGCRQADRDPFRHPHAITYIHADFYTHAHTYRNINAQSDGDTHFHVDAVTDLDADSRAHSGAADRIGDGQCLAA